MPNLIGRTRIFFPALLGVGILVPVFTYNISRTNWGLAFIIASFAAILVLAAYDRRYLRPQRDCDNEARLFPADPNRPKALPMPAHMAERTRSKAEKRQKQAAPTADEEIAHYLGSAPKKQKKPKLTPAERAERRRAERDYRRSLRAVRRWRKTQRRARIAAGGFAGVGMLALAMLILLIPTAYIEGSFTTVEFIDEPMQIIRRYVTAYLMGDNPILDEMGYGGNTSNFAPHSTDAAPRVFTGEEIFEVETMYNTNLYLRGWIANQYRDGSWHTADSRGDDPIFDEYRATFGTAFSPEVMRTNFYSYVDPSVTTLTDYTKRYQNNTERGFVTMQVNLRRVGGNSNMVYPPSYFNPKVGILQYISGEPTEYTFVNYYDGIYTGRRFLPGAEYAAVTYATTMRDDTFMDKVAVDIAAYNLANYAAQTWFASTEDTDFSLGDSLTAISENGAVAMSVEYRETGLIGKLISNDPVYADVQGQRTLDLANDIFNRYLNMTESELADLKYAWRVEDYYRAFAYKTYTADADSDIILRAAQDAVDSDLWKQVEGTLADMSVDPAAYTARHDAVMRVMAYLSAASDSGEKDENGDPIMIPNFTYTLTPTKQPDTALDGVENFLTVTKEGYCVQFASAAALMLREMGIPARYVEGYIVTDFRRNLASTSSQRYSASVRDWHAHAWIEVYYDGIGWLNYEATPAYVGDMYAFGSGSGNEPTPINPMPEPAPEEEPDIFDSIDPEELLRLEREQAAREARERLIRILVTVGLCLLVLALLVLTVVLILRATHRADRERKALLAAVRRGLPDDETGREAARLAAVRLIDEVTLLLAVFGLAPAVGEQRSAYAARLAPEFGPLCP
ncbi:MAG: transglutaminase domain-containing protein, partial [Clostridia bacterium]|nr:transglutaminase domain-containing protein [Clostridia bacterium]